MPRMAGRRLSDPEEVTWAAVAHRAESDVVSRFLGECGISHGRVGSTDLYQRQPRPPRIRGLRIQPIADSHTIQDFK